MIATVVYVSPSAFLAQLFVLGVCVGLAVLVLIAHLVRPAVKRMMAAAAFSVALAAGAAVTVRADDGDFVITNPCKDLSPSDWEWWMYGCMWP